MSEEQKAAYVMGQAACLMSTVLGMYAENMQRAAEGKSMAYDHAAFEAATNDYSCHHNAAISLFLHDTTV
jgi:hypothetical protein